MVITLLGHGCPVQAMVAAFGLEARTVSGWWARSGQPGDRVHEALGGQSHLDLGPVQADEIRVKTQHGIVWMAFALMVSTRLWLGGGVSPRRDTALIERLVSQPTGLSCGQIRVIAQFHPLLLAVDGLTTYVTAFRKAFRFPAPTGSRTLLALGALAARRHGPGHYPQGSL